jgi:hypothetical protein
MAEKIFADGLIVKQPRENAPEFVMGSLSVKVEEFKHFLDAHVTNAGWVNIDLLVGKSGKPYAALNTYKPEKPDSLKEDEPGMGDLPDASLIPF